MSHSEKRGHWVKEGVIGTGVGIIFGLTVTATGHPFDTIKTKMQAQKGFENLNMFQSAVTVLKQEGVRGLYRGCIPPLWGSGIYRSIQFSAFEATYTFLENSDWAKTEIPGTCGLQIRVILGGLMSGSCRSIVECPLEYAKTKRQTGVTWRVKDVYTGFGITCLRATMLMPTFFIIFDSLRRNFPDLFKTSFLGPFVFTGMASVTAWWIVWPLELVRCQIQAGFMAEKNLSIIQRMKFIVRERGGILGLYRGIMPGSMRSFVGNGSGMVAMQFCQRKITELGLRDD